MLQEAATICSDISVLRRLSFAAVTLHRDTPRYWELVASFGFLKSSGCAIPSSDKVKILLENGKYLDDDAFDTDSHLLREFIQHDGFQGKSLGIVLISAKDKCRFCGGNLLVRADRPSFPVIYSDDLGTVSGTHFRKYCQNNWKGCPFTQHYGFYTNVNESEAVYDDDYTQLPYFFSSHMTVFETKLLCHLTAEMLLGQISYRQRSDIYNYIHGCDSAKKESVQTMPHCFDEKDTNTSRYMYICTAYNYSPLEIQYKGLSSSSSLCKVLCGWVYPCPVY